MAMRFMEPEAVLNLMRLAESRTPPPPEITQLKEEIEGRTRVAEFKTSVTGQVDMEEVGAIVQLKLRLDGLYGLWAEGKLGH